MSDLPWHNELCGASFGQPACGDRYFRNSFPKGFSRVVYANDIAPTHPGGIYKHCGKPLHLRRDGTLIAGIPWWNKLPPLPFNLASRVLDHRIGEYERLLGEPPAVAQV